MAIPLYFVFNLWYLVGLFRKRESVFSFRQARNRRRTFGEIALTLFDVVGPKYLWEFHEEEVLKWFRERGFEDVRSTDTVDIGICGRKKAGAPSTS
jgi:hypothetical protein